MGRSHAQPAQNQLKTKKMKHRHLFAALAATLCALTASAQNLSGTYFFQQRDTCDLYMDVYEPSKGSETSIDGVRKPTILFVFGGGFVGGERSRESYLPWFKLLNDNGYRLITIDYRLGLKGVNVRFGIFHILATAKATKKAVDIGVEDVYAAVGYIVDNAASLGVEPGNTVLAGSSAGAMIALSSEYEICNGTDRAATLPDGFNFAGVMSFAGAIMSDSGKPSYASEPCPQLFLHGTADKTVNYGKTRFGRWGIFGSNALDDICAAGGYNYSIYRYKDHAHDIADNFVATWPQQETFLEHNVMKKERRIVDTVVDDPSIPKWDAATLDSLY